MCNYIQRTPATIIHNNNNNNNSIIYYVTIWEISMNPEKTTATISSNRALTSTETIEFGNTRVKWSMEVKYLGVTIDSKLTLSSHVNNVIRKANGAKFSLYPLIDQFSPLSIRIKLYICTTYIKPILMYAGPAWTARN